MMSSVLSTLSFRKREVKKEDMADRHSGILDSREYTRKIATSVLMGQWTRKKTIATVLQNRWSFCHTSRM
ncbi:unnamed protein product [Ranitomeya imitator]|uniref:Uncharacterized protein n=1 Tax=Ranitomeya imitator TaxID=111125 RepID=A0ABN9M284_9NEOB|nr:unnamed protein product [Ranitomeya imitator]